MCGGIFFKLLAIAAIEIFSNMRFTVEMYRRMAGLSSNREISPEIGKIEILRVCNRIFFKLRVKTDMEVFSVLIRFFSRFYYERENIV